MEYGFLNINKPANCTSHDVVATLRKSIGIKRIGHSGTLDPFATGVLVIGINEATRLFEYLPSDKVYIANITFGTETDTNDITGKIIRESNYIPLLEEIKEKLKDLTGRIKQKPPIFSAIKINGHRAYKLARENKISEDNIDERTVEIYSIKIISYSSKDLQVEIHCSSGTYIRSIARDLGKLLNSCAVLSNLQRVNAGKFTIDNSVSLDSINKLTLKEHLISPISALQ
ncbi:MAG: tRNA pseudouridine55 synthase, partial [bacterium]